MEAREYLDQLLAMAPADFHRPLRRTTRRGNTFYYRSANGRTLHVIVSPAIRRQLVAHGSKPSA